MLAGFRPGSRDPFVSAKGPKTIDARTGMIKMGQTRTVREQPNSLRSNKGCGIFRASVPGACQQASDEAKREKPREDLPTTFLGNSNDSGNAEISLR